SGVRPVWHALPRPPHTSPEITVNATSLANIPATSAQKYEISVQGRTPKTIISTPTAIAPRKGHRKLRFKLSSEVLRHARSGPVAVSKSSSSVTGIVTLL